MEGQDGVQVGKETDIDGEGKVECVGKLCYLGDMEGSGGGAEEASRARVRCSWTKRCSSTAEREPVTVMQCVMINRNET